MLVRTIAVALSLSCLLGACAKDAPPPSETTAPQARVPPARAPLQLGEPISPQAVPLALSDLATHPSDFRDRTIATSGIVTAVCQSMGCWMEIKDDKSAAHIRMHGHSFFVPKTASGHHARVQATLVSADDKTECDDEGTDAGHAMAKVELDATGIELD